MTATVSLEAPSRLRWIHRASIDVPVALAWVPFAIAAASLKGNGAALNWLVGATLLFSVAHQPLTLGLVYGDPQQFAIRKRIFTWSPIIFAVAIAIGLNVSFTTVGIIAGLWNAHHTLMQRYGLTRIYGRKAGDDHGRLELRMLYSWLVLALVWAAADVRTAEALDAINLGARNEVGIALLTEYRTLALVLLGPVVAASAWFTLTWIGVERQRGVDANPAKHVYIATTAALFAVMLIDPIVGFVAYVGAHAAEYFVTVHQALGKRYVQPRDPSPLGRAVRTRLGRAGAIAVLVAGTFAMLRLIDAVGTARIATVFLLTVGALHIFYDGFIWKLRRPQVAASVGIDVGTAGADAGPEA